MLGYFMDPDMLGIPIVIYRECGGSYCTDSIPGSEVRFGNRSLSGNKFFEFEYYTLELKGNLGED